MLQCDLGGEKAIQIVDSQVGEEGIEGTGQLRDERDETGSQREVKVSGVESEEVVAGRDVVRFSQEEGRNGVRVLEGVFEVKLHGRERLSGAVEGAWG